VSDLFTFAGGDPQLMPTIIADKVCGIHIVPAITAALYHRAMTGEGDSIEVPMAEVMASFNLIEHLGGLTFEPPIGPFSYARGDDTQPTSTSHPRWLGRHPSLQHSELA